MSAEQWAPFATRRPGPPQKHGCYGVLETGDKEGIVCHSAEGPLSAMLWVLDSLELTPFGYYRYGSWTFSNPKVGPLLQHFPVRFHTWASGSKDANVRFGSCESEGRAGEPLNENQVSNLVDLILWHREEFDWPEIQRLRQLFEHWECARFGSAPTACPSNRYDWRVIMERIREQMALADEIRELRAEIALLKSGQAFQNKALTSHEDRLKFLQAVAVEHERRIRTIQET